MKRMIAIGLFVNAVLLAGILLKKEVVVHAAGGEVPVGNGDVNGDGQIDISDVAYLVNALYLGGPALKAIECPAPVVKGLPATGQTKCYDKDGNEIACNSSDFPRQDGFYQAGCPSQGRFVDHGDGTVTDKCTGLMWQRDTADIDGNGTIGEGDNIDWQTALKYCANLGLGGYQDWRLPNVRELESMIDYGQSSPVTIDRVFGAVGDWYWSSTSASQAYPPDNAWSVHFYSGVVEAYTDKQGDSGYVRAVRNAP